MGTSSVAKIIIFVLCLNLASSLMMMAIVDFTGDKIFKKDIMGTNDFDRGQYTNSQLFIDSIDIEIQPEGQLEDKGNLIYRVLDMMGLGFMTKIGEAMKAFLFGFPEVLNSLFGSYLETEVQQFLFGTFGIFKILLSSLYVFYIISLITGKDVTNVSG